MKKLKLDLQNLSVESFETGSAKAEKGTVKANEQVTNTKTVIDDPSNQQCSFQDCDPTPTFNNTCNMTCDQSCGGTCDHTCGINSCYHTCNASCWGTCTYPIER